MLFKVDLPPKYGLASCNYKLRCKFVTSPCNEFNFKFGTLGLVDDWIYSSYKPLCTIIFVVGEPSWIVSVN